MACPQRTRSKLTRTCWRSSKQELRRLRLEPISGPHTVRAGITYTCARIVMKCARRETGGRYWVVVRAQSDCDVRSSACGCRISTYHDNRITNCGAGMHRREGVESTA